MKANLGAAIIRWSLRGLFFTLPLTGYAAETTSGAEPQGDLMPQITKARDGRVTITARDPHNGFWTLEASEDMRTWSPVKTTRSTKDIATHKHTGASGKRRSLYYRLVNANTIDRVLQPDLAQTFEVHVPGYFNARETTTIVTSSTSGGGWSGSSGSEIPRLVTQREMLDLEQVFFRDQARNNQASLGRVLFYDKRLSANNTVSCASCHKQENAFADTKPFSDGIHDQKTLRNSMPLANLAFSGKGKFFWDMRESTLKETVLKPIQNPVEMGTSLELACEKVAAEPFYATLFERAFGTPEVTEDRMATGLSEFLSAMISSRSKFDHAQTLGMRHMTEKERLGRNLFNGKAGCVQCHSFPFFDSTSPTNNGLELEYKDPGVAGVTKDSRDTGAFKTPSLRNVELTAPYMHDGRFKTLMEVVDFYNKKIQPHDRLDDSLRQTVNTSSKNWEKAPASERVAVTLGLTEFEREAIVDFMKTLTDHNLATDERFSDPFR